MSKSLNVAESPGVYLAGGAYPVMMEWSQLMKLRPAVLKHSRMPKYLLLPEIRALLTTVRDANSHLLFSTLWHTGARISEALALTPGSFELDPSIAYVSLKTLKKKEKERPRRGVIRLPMRMVPIRDRAYLDEVASYLATYKPKPGERIFPFTRQAASVRLSKAIANYEDVTGKEFGIPVSLHTFRHSFAVNAVLHGVSLVSIMECLGHADIETTMIYTRVLGVDTGNQWARVSY